MPNCFTLTRKGEDKPSLLTAVDEAMCAHFDKPVHPTQWFQAWYDIEGLGLACGKTWEWMREKMPERKEIIDFLEANYDANAWHEHR
jgi:hypothetical protein